MMQTSKAREIIFGIFSFSSQFLYWFNFVQKLLLGTSIIDNASSIEGIFHIPFSSSFNEDVTRLLEAISIEMFSLRNFFDQNHKMPSTRCGLCCKFSSHTLSILSLFFLSSCLMYLRRVDEVRAYFVSASVWTNFYVNSLCLNFSTLSKLSNSDFSIFEWKTFHSDKFIYLCRSLIFLLFFFVDMMIFLCGIGKREKRNQQASLDTWV